MTGTGRAAALALGACAAVGGLALVAKGDGGGFGLLIFAALILCGAVFERRYGRSHGQSGDGAVQWQLTGERFIDDESGDAVEVWSDPLTGERRYVPLGRTARRP